MGAATARAGIGTGNQERVEELRSLDGNGLGSKESRDSRRGGDDNGACPEFSGIHTHSFPVLFFAFFFAPQLSSSFIPPRCPDPSSHPRQSSLYLPSLLLDDSSYWPDPEFPDSLRFFPWSKQGWRLPLDWRYH